MPDLHRNGLVDSRLDVPAGRIPRVREQRVRARYGLFGILLVDLVAGLAAVFRNGQHAKGLEGLQRISRFPVYQSHAKPQIVTQISYGE